jgi:phage-related protein
MVELRRFPALFFRTQAGTEPVREWLRSLPKQERVVIGNDLQRLEYRWPVGMPLSRPLGEGLHELRSNLPNGRTARILFFAASGQLVLLAGFIKKTRATPKAELELARARKRAWERAHG